MNQSILDRYSRTDSNAIIIDVTTEKVEDLYNNFDRNAPFVKKDLDDELTEYLVEAAAEIGREDFVIRFRFAQPVDAELATRVTDSVRNYFRYMKERETRAIGQMVRKSAIFLASGLLILTLAIALNRAGHTEDSVVVDVFVTGMTVAAWVSLWEALATILVHWAPHRRMRRTLERISQATLVFE